MSKVFVSGVYDLLHSGHIAFFEECSKYGDLYVGVGSDDACKLYKREPIHNEEVRLYMVQSIKFVKDALILQSTEPIMNFEYYFREHWKPDILIVNEDSFNKEQKQALCDELGIQFKVLKRMPHGTLPNISTTSIIEKIKALQN
ncbi:MAG: adenylyltransferase/cytidyltransferase family protein [Rickettsiales bacterium]|jgi:cytidyltransferase-like protein|nr:adenylyltransferase/cytidyltransferase family protein [Rickettsiales bacterium]